VSTALPAPGAKARVSDRTRSERKLGWTLAGPACAVMLAAAGSLFWYRHNDLADPAAEFADGGTGTQISDGWNRYTDVLASAS